MTRLVVATVIATWAVLWALYGPDGKPLKFRAKSRYQIKAMARQYGIFDANKQRRLQKRKAKQSGITQEEAKPAEPDDADVGLPDVEVTTDIEPG